MKIAKAIITAAGRGQRSLPLQTLIDRDGQQKSVLTVIIEEVVRAGINSMCFIVHPDDEHAFRSVAGIMRGGFPLCISMNRAATGMRSGVPATTQKGSPFCTLWETISTSAEPQAAAPSVLSARQKRRPVRSRRCSRPVRASFQFRGCGRQARPEQE